MAEVIKLEGISKLYHTKESETEALKNISFSVNENEFLSIIGPSGCGKSTVLSIIAGLIPFSSGKITFNKSNRIGYMLQEDHLFPWLTVRQNAQVGLKTMKIKDKHNILRIDEMLKQYGLWDFRDAHPSALSGGMRQRVALIRTLAIEPALLLLDEPFSALDYQTRLAVSDDIHGIIKSQRKTAILITHDISEAISMSDRIIVLTSRPAQIKAIHKIDLCNEPIKRRKSKKFSTYFQILWEELNVSE